MCITIIMFTFTSSNNNKNLKIEIMKTLTELNEKLNGRIWSKNGIERIYLDEGYNTKKMKTTTYVQVINDSFVVKCFIECPSQDYNWIKSQQERVIESVEEKIEEILNPTEEVEEETDTVFVKTIIEPKVIEVKKVNTGVVNSTYVVGQDVYHDKFGNGKVVEFDGTKVIVDFGGEISTKPLLAKFVKMTILS